MGPILREFAYAIRTAVNKTTGKTPAELFLGRKLITSFQKLVMVSDGTEFSVGDMERLFEEARRSTETKHEKWKKYYKRRKRVNETTGKTPAELFLGRKLITPFRKLVMVSDGTEFVVGDIERLFEEARRNTETKHEKWKNYYKRCRLNVQIKLNDSVLVATHPLSSATRKVVAKFKPKFESPYTVLDVKNNNVVIWKAGKRLTINVDQVRIYRHRKCDETEIGTDCSNNGSLRDESSSFDRVQRRSNDSRDGKKKGSEVKRELEEKGLSFRNNQGEKHTNKTNKRGPLIRSIPSSWSEKDRMIKKKSKNEKLGYERSHESRSGGPERKV
ncbi:uncharacterized protein TNCV_1542051 [Trichonephila clavipes]|nr:uncharacterized protein TNCV_1542051 [Trichonephila clavipes]